LAHKTLHCGLETLATTIQIGRKIQMRKVLYVSASLITLGSLAACTTPGASDAPDVYGSNEVNQAQAATVVNILAVLPARVNEDNSANQQTASNVGTVLGAVGGALLGGLAFHGGYGGAAIGAAGGGLIGSAAGATQPVSVLVQGVSITYTVGSGAQPMNSVEVGQLCQFHTGQGIMVTNGPGVTRIQPNAVCPPPATKA
jgi:outer membrane lipoprotein SlyB